MKNTWHFFWQLALVPENTSIKKKSEIHHFWYSLRSNNFYTKNAMQTILSVAKSNNKTVQGQCLAVRRSVSFPPHLSNYHSHIHVISRCIKLPFLNHSLEITLLPLIRMRPTSVIYLMSYSVIFFSKIYLLLQFLSQFLLYFIMIVDTAPPPPSPQSACARLGDLAIFGASPIWKKKFYK